jgi:pimeloyl-ACP methyl ester carboxylesterase
MSAAVSKHENETSPVKTLQNAAIRRDAFYLPSQGQPLMAWLHTGVGQPCLDHGVIICPSIGYEQLHAHRSLRYLADDLANQGVPTLRFDWHGTGDSAGIDEDPNRCATWQANLRDAVEWMRQVLGCRQVSIVGLRIGAALAALAAEEVEVANLVMWAPVINGRAFVREMTAIELTAEFRPAPHETPTGDIEAGGFVLSKLAAAELSQLNLLKSHPWCQQALIVGRDDHPIDLRWHDRCVSLGFPAEQIQVPGYQEMLAEPHRCQVPQRAILQIVSWLHTQIVSDTVGELCIDFDHLGSTIAQMQQRPESSLIAGNSPQIQERLVRISREPDLFGILSEPVEAAADLPAIIVLNSGSAYHIGPGRLHVHLTRQLAAEGYRCLRMDINGLGDSITENPAAENETYPGTAFRDVDLAISALQRDFGVQKCVLLGLCSGAYAAFQSAASIPNPALIESVLLNPLTFFWTEGMTLESAPVGELVARHYYLSSALQPKKWLKLLSGQTEIGLWGAAKLLLNRLGLRGTRAQMDTHETDSSASVRIASHPDKDDLPADLASISRAGRTLAMFFAVSDPGYSILMHKARQDANRLLRAGQLQISFIKDADHTFSRRSARQALLDSILMYLRDRFA